MINKLVSASADIAGKGISLETGVMAKQANGSVTVRAGDMVLLATATMAKNARENLDFMPLTIEYSEKMYAAGKIPGGFFKREARPSTNATLIARLIDRPLRPSFPKNVNREVQVVITMLSYDPSVVPDFLSIIAASAALSLSDIPFNGPIGAAIVGLEKGQLIANPDSETLKTCDLNIIVAGTKEAVLMVEAGANEVSEEIVLEAIQLAHKHIKESIELQENLVGKMGKEKVVLPEPKNNDEIESKIRELVSNKIENSFKAGNKKQTEDFLCELEVSSLALFDQESEEELNLAKKCFAKIKKEKIRSLIIEQKIRPDGRKVDEIRPIEIELGILPSVHGSALFTRGETQSLTATTLGSAMDEQIIDGLNDNYKKRYYFHYNFPPFSVGEVGFFRTGRRELGHGALAEKALIKVLPDHDSFPYTLRIVSEILESNGSSSMASVCAGSLSLMDCGVPIKSAVSGIAMGLLIENDSYVVLSDIQGLEDHYGDMDFKVAGTADGITALQLDIKVAGLSNEILKNALSQAKEGRLYILDKMVQAISAPREELSAKAPKIGSITIDPEKVGLVIGPGGKMIRRIEEESGATVVVKDGDTGNVSIAAKSQESLDKAKNMIYILTKELVAGDIFEGKVSRVTNFGAFVEILPGKDGLLHISKISKNRIEKVEDVLNVGDLIKVKINEIDKQNRINLVPVDLL
jgi:polyribonucleotide nucleotidyltransferase